MHLFIWPKLFGKINKIIKSVAELLLQFYFLKLIVLAYYFKQKIQIITTKYRMIAFHSIYHENSKIPRGKNTKFEYYSNCPSFNRTHHITYVWFFVFINMCSFLLH